MIYRSATKPVQLFANFGGALLVGLFFAFVGLNAASGCGETRGHCIALKDFAGQDRMIAAR